MVIDKQWLKIECSRCKNTEVLPVTESGSMFLGSTWSIPEASKFSITYSGGGNDSITIDTAICKECQEAARVITQMGFVRPSFF